MVTPNAAAPLARAAAFVIGGLQVFANAVLLLRGLSRLPAEIVREGASARIADLLRTAWTYGMLGNLCVGAVLVVLAPALGRGEPLARRLAMVIAVYYVVVGVATYAFGPVRHAGFLVFVVFGVVLLAAVLLG